MKVFLLALSLLFIVISPVSAESSSEDDCNGKISFKTVEVSIESKKNALAAYQVDLRYNKEKIKIVGLEGGSKAFDKPPFYDRAGLDGGRIIIAAFVDNDMQARKGKTRVARLHLQTKGCPPYDLISKPMAAVKPGGKNIPVEVEVSFIDDQNLNNN